MKKTLKLIIALVLSLSTFQVSATHLMGGDITYVCIGPNQYSIVAKLFQDCTGAASLQPTLTVNVSSANCNYNQNINLSNVNGATTSFIAPLCDLSQDACVNPSGAYGVEQFFYRGIVTLPSCVSGSDFVISWTDCCRNNAITTLSNPGGASIYLYAKLNNTIPDCNNSPAFNFEPTVYLCLGQENHFNNGITDIDGDRLQFSLTNCLDNATTPVTYANGFSATQPLTTSSISIDSETGQIDLTPTQAQVGVLCIKVEEFRGSLKIGETIRDLQFTVLDCGTNDLPVISGFNGTASSLGTTGSYSHTACVGETLEFDLKSFDAQGQPSIASQNLVMDWGIGIAGASFIIDDTSSTLPSAVFSWTPTAADVGMNFFTVAIRDDACTFNGISVFTYKIKVNPNVLNYSANIPHDTIVSDNSTLVIDINQGNFGPAYQFFWSTNSSDPVLSCTNCPDPVFTPVPGLEVTYEIYMLYKDISSTTNCVVRDTFRIMAVVSTNPIDKLVQQVMVYPNPFKTDALLTYNLNQRSEVMVEVYDMLGKRVGTLANETQNAGEHQVQIGDAINQVKGIYFVRLSVDGQSITKKIVVQ